MKWRIIPILFTPTIQHNTTHNRYAPLMTQTILTFPVVGISLPADQTYICNSHTCTISLEQLEASTSGSYRCEVSGDAPEFKLDSQTANMTVAGRNESNPRTKNTSNSCSLTRESRLLCASPPPLLTGTDIILLPSFSFSSSWWSILVAYLATCPWSVIVVVPGANKEEFL